MDFIDQILNLLNTQEKKWSAMITLISSLIIVTPLCGFLFQCGCDWPWAGLDSKCNFYKTHIAEKCPWCASIAMGVLSTGVAIISGVWLSIFFQCFFTSQVPIKEVIMRVLYGLTMFIGVAILMSKVAVQWQGYSA